MSSINSQVGPNSVKKVLKSSGKGVRRLVVKLQSKVCGKLNSNYSEKFGRLPNKFDL